MTGTTMNISLPEVMKDFVDTQLHAGGYSTTSEYVRELIRKDQIAKAEAKLKELLLDGLNSGPAVIVDENFFAQMKARVKAHRANAAA